VGDREMLNLQDLIDDAKCYSEVRRLRWPEGVRCPTCNSAKVTKRGKHNRQKERQRYECGDCQKQFDDLTDSIFEGHHQPLKVWILCLYFMGLNLSNQQIGQELGLNKDDVQAMTSQLRSGVMEKKSR
jgi:transposase-like protein